MTAPLTRLWLLACLLITTPLYAGDSTIVEAEGQACTEIPGQAPRTRKQLEDAAREDAKREAAKRVATRIRSSVSSDVVVAKNEGKEQVYTLGKVLSSAYVNADVKELATLKLEPFIDPDQGNCLKALLRVEVVPKADALDKIGNAVLDDPTLPLSVRIWTDRSKSGETAVYRKGEHMRFYLRGNKPFYARVIYTSSNGQILQVLPNPYRRENHFQGGTLVVLPSSQDSFEMEVTEPLGSERVTVYASERPLGELKLQPAGSVYVVEDNKGPIANQVRGIKLTPTGGATKTDSTAEFSEYAVDVITTP